MPEPRAITIGAFDGVHLGHAALLAAARSAAGPRGRVVAITFEPHPLRVLAPARAPARLSSVDQRRRWLTEAGADDVVVLEPTRDLLSQSPQAFLERLAAEHRPDFIVEGSDFRFGRDRAGSVETLRSLGGALRFRAIVPADVHSALTNGTTVRVTSSIIRWLIGHGRVRDAARLLGRPYELVGTVVRGEGRGASELGTATANLDHGDHLLPADGIYSGTAVLSDGTSFPAAISVGTKPTFGAHPRVCEAHLLRYHGKHGQDGHGTRSEGSARARTHFARQDASQSDKNRSYGWTMGLQFGDWLRDQVAFSSADLLIEQIRRDVRRVEDEAGCAHG